MRKHVRFGLGICLAILVSACGGGSGNGSGSDQGETASSTPPTNTAGSNATFSVEFPQGELQLVSEDGSSAETRVHGTLEGIGPSDLLSVFHDTANEHIQGVYIESNKIDITLIFQAFHLLPTGTYNGNIDVDLCSGEECIALTFRYNLVQEEVNPIFTLETSGQEVALSTQQYYEDHSRFLISQEIDINYLGGQVPDKFRLHIEPRKNYILQPLRSDFSRIFSIEQVDANTFDLQPPRYQRKLDYRRFPLTFRGPNGELSEVELYFTPHLRSGQGNEFEVSSPELHIGYMRFDSFSDTMLKVALPLGVEDYTVEITYDQEYEWLELEKAQHSRLNIRAFADDLDPGHYTATLQLSANSGTSLPLDIPINLYVSTDDLLPGNHFWHHLGNDNFDQIPVYDSIDFTVLDGLSYNWNLRSTATWLIPETTSGMMPMDNTSFVSLPDEELIKLDYRQEYSAQIIIQTDYDEVPWMVYSTDLSFNLPELHTISPMEVSANQAFTLTIIGNDIASTELYIGEQTFEILSDQVSFINNVQGSVESLLDTTSVNVNGLAVGQYEVGLRNSRGVPTQTFTLSVTN